MKTRIRAGYMAAVALTGFAAAGVSAQSTTVTGVPADAEQCAVVTAGELPEGTVMFRKSADGTVALKASEHGDVLLRATKVDGTGEPITITRKITKTVDADGNVTIVEVPVEEGDKIFARTALRDKQSVLAEGEKVHVKRPNARGGKLEPTVVDGHNIVIDRLPADGTAKVRAFSIDGKELDGKHKVECRIMLRSKTDQ